MKTMILTIASVLAISAVALAQPPGGGGGRPGGGGGFGGGGRQGGGGGGMMRMYEQLGLTEAQKTKLKSVTDKQREESAALRKKHEEQINAILTPEQRKKMEAARKEMMERFRGMGGPGGPGGGAPGGAKPGGKKG